MRSSKKSNESKQASRRQFAKTIATSLITVPLAASLAKAQTTSPSATPTPRPSPSPTPPSPIAEAYAEVARARFGEMVTPDEMTKIKEDLEGNVRAADRLRKFKLENGDEPDFVFSAD